MALFEANTQSAESLRNFLHLIKSPTTPSSILQSLNWTSVLIQNPDSHEALQSLTTSILSRNNPKALKDLVLSLLNSIFS